MSVQSASLYSDYSLYKKNEQIKDSVLQKCAAEAFSKIKETYQSFENFYIFDLRTEHISPILCGLVFSFIGCAILSAKHPRLFYGAIKIVSVSFLFGLLRNCPNWLLSLAVYMDFPFLVKILIKCGGDLNRKNMENLAAIHYAAGSSNSDMLKLLVDGGADPKLPGGFDLYNHSCARRTPLQIAICANNINSVKYLLSLPDVRLQAEDIAISVHYGSEPLLQFLKEHHQSDLQNVRDSKGNTPLHYFVATYFEPPKCYVGEDTKINSKIHFLLNECKIDINYANIFGMTALHFAMFESHKWLVNALISYGHASCSTKDRNGCTPIDYATCFRRNHLLQEPSFAGEDKQGNTSVNANPSNLEQKIYEALQDASLEYYPLFFGVNI